jgi:hypothetical protein
VHGFGVSGNVYQSLKLISIGSEVLNVTLSHLATKAELAQIEVKLVDKPGKTYMWGILAALLTAYACGLAALVVLK